MIGRWCRFRMLAAIGALALGCGAAPVSAQKAEPPDDRRQILVLLRLPAQHYRLNADYGGSYGDDLTQSARRRIAKRIARHHGLALVDDWPMPLLGLDCFIMAVPEGETAETAAAQVSRDSGVDWAQPMHRYQVQGQEPTHNDPLFPAQPVAREWRLADLHQLATGRGVTVAVIDSRIDAGHPDLAGQVATMQDFAPDHPAGPEQHGTGVAGIIAAKADNGLGIAGVAPRAQLMGLRACWQSLAHPPASVCDSLSLAKALHFAIEHNAQVINLSLSGPQDMLLGRLIDVGLRRGATVVAAFDRSQPDGGFPASQPGVIAVADDALAASSLKVYTAPGNDIPTTEPGGRWYLVNGSSYAAAHVSGLIALMRERRAHGGGPFALVSARAEGGAIDACATLLGGDRSCDCACAFPSKMAANIRR